MAKAKVNASQRSLALLRGKSEDGGYKAWSVEKWKAFFNTGPSALDRTQDIAKAAIEYAKKQEEQRTGCSALTWNDLQASLHAILLIKPDRTGGVRSDMGGFGDIIAIHPQATGCLAVQATTKQQITKHLREYRGDKEVRENILLWLQTGNRLVIHGWYKVMIPNKSNDGTHARWQCDTRWITAENMELNELDKMATFTVS